MEKEELIKSLEAEKILNQLFIICSLVLFLFGCSPEKQSIQSIEVHYIPGISESPFSNCCDSTPDTWSGEYFVDTIITNTRVLEEISTELQRLKQIDTMYPVNGNISCTIKFSNDSTARLCMGSLIGTIYDCNQYHDNLTLNYLIKKNSGFYYFIPYQLILELPEIKSSPSRIAVINSEESSYTKIGGEPTLDEDGTTEIHEIGWNLPFLKKK